LVVDAGARGCCAERKDAGRREHDQVAATRADARETSLDSTQPIAPAYRGRFAPSPTGPLHFGSLVAAVASYCDARSNGGEWLLRIEDVDQPRSRSGASDAILAALEAHGFVWDGPVVRQSQRTRHYEDAIAVLRRSRQVYDCTCTRKELATAPVGAGGEHVYPGTCRNGAATGRAARALRVAVGSTEIGYEDRLQGWQQQRLDRDVGDFVIKRADGFVAYQLAVVVDDELQGITHVVRGADLLASTPRQIWLQRLLGFRTPSYLHHAVAVDAARQKLSKQSGAAPLPPDAVRTLAAAWRFLGQRASPASIGTIAEFWRWAHAHWDVASLPRAASLPVGN
jgi:glutamyl-Q tRNA(Asp) synthetase